MEPKGFIYSGSLYRYMLIHVFNNNMTYCECSVYSSLLRCSGGLPPGRHGWDDLSLLATSEVEASDAR